MAGYVGGPRRCIPHPAAPPPCPVKGAATDKGESRPSETHQIHLRPADFFTSNPGLDVPSDRNEASVRVACCGTGADRAPEAARGASSDAGTKGAAGGKEGGNGGNRLSQSLAGLLGLKRDA